MTSDLIACHFENNVAKNKCKLKLFFLNSLENQTNKGAISFEWKL